MIDTLHNATLRYLVSNEGPTTVYTENLAIQSEKVSLKNLGKTGNEAANSGFKMPSADVFGLGTSKMFYEPRIIVTLSLPF